MRVSLASKESATKASNDKNTGICPYWLIWEDSAGKGSGKSSEETPKSGVAKTPGRFRFAN